MIAAQNHDRAAPAPPGAGAGSSHPVLEVRALDKSFGGVQAVRSVSFDVGAGEVLGLVGANGAGKSTIIRILAGVIKPDDGEIRLDGSLRQVFTTAGARAEGIAVVHQELALVDSQSVAENIFLGHPRPRRLGVIDWSAMYAEAVRACTALGIEIDVRRPVATLSTWEKWATILVREMRTTSRVLILDEPTAAMDEEHVHKVFDAVAAAKARAAGTIFVSHRIAEVMAICDRVHVLRDGRSVGQSRTADLSRERLVRMIVGPTTSGRRAANRTSAPAVQRSAETVLAVTALKRGARSRPVSFEVRAGDIVGLAGLVGSGRSGMLRALAGADRPADGQVTVGGSRVRLGSVSQARRAGMVFVGEDRLVQGLVDILPIAANISLGRTGGRWRDRAVISSSREADTAMRWINRLHIAGAQPDGLVTQLSGGNQQKLLFARALELKPRVLLLDEPTRGVDIGSRHEIYGMIRDFTDGGGAVLTAMSDLDELAELATAALVLREGVLVETLEHGTVSRGGILEACYGGA